MSTKEFYIKVDVNDVETCSALLGFGPAEVLTLAVKHKLGESLGQSIHPLHKMPDGRVLMGFSEYGEKYELTHKDLGFQTVQIGGKTKIVHVDYFCMEDS